MRAYPEVLDEVYARGPAFLPLLGAPLEPTFWNRAWNGQGLFLNFRDILKTAHSNCGFIFGSKKKSQVARLGERGVGDLSHDFSDPNLLHWQSCVCRRFVKVN